MSDYFIFDDIDTRDFEGIYVYFNEIDTTPKRVGEYIEIPNRNGALFLDAGRYEDVPHSYDIIALSAETGRDLINALASKVGHYRLEDSFHPDEFYSAVFDTEVTPNVPRERDQSTFKVSFTRKPQRFLIEGETAVSVDDGDTLTNPTLFEASPMLEVEGYGKVVLDNGYEIDLVNGILGNVQILEGGQKTLTGNATTVSGSATFDRSLVEVGDTITISGKQYSSSPNASVSARALFSDSKKAWINNATNTDVNVISSYCQLEGDTNPKQAIGFSAVPTTFTVGTAGTFTASTQYSYTEHLYNSQTTGTATFKVSVTISYDGNDTITTTMTRTLVADTLNNYSYNSSEASKYTRFEATADSSVSIMGQPTYIDCDIGEVYKVEGDTIVSLNRYVDLGSKLPTLAVGGTEITYDNTITDLKVVPRWWKV